MDDKTLQALTASANKLGTTAEYLWVALLRQAPVAGMVDMVLMLVYIAVSVWWTAFVARKTTAPLPTLEDKFPDADWEQEAAFLAWVSVFIVWLITATFITCNLSLAISALINPDYWALRQLIK